MNVSVAVRAELPTPCEMRCHFDTEVFFKVDFPHRVVGIRVPEYLDMPDDWDAGGFKQNDVVTFKIPRSIIPSHKNITGMTYSLQRGPKLATLSPTATRHKSFYSSDCGGIKRPFCTTSPTANLPSTTVDKAGFTTNRCSLHVFGASWIKLHLVNIQWYHAVSI